MKRKTIMMVIVSILFVVGCASAQELTMDNVKFFEAVVLNDNIEMIDSGKDTLSISTKENKYLLFTIGKRHYAVSIEDFNSVMSEFQKNKQCISSFSEINGISLGFGIDPNDKSILIMNDMFVINISTEPEKLFLFTSY